MVSIVLCTYNGEKYLEEQLASIVNQSYGDLEIVICDDVSKDNTVAIAEKYAAEYPFIQIYQNEKNLGYNKNFMQGFDRTTGDVIAICDQDDVWHKDKIKIMMEAWLPQHPIIYCDAKSFTGNTIPADAKTNPIYRRFEGTDARKLAIYNTISGHAMLFRKSFLPLIKENLPENIIYDWWTGVLAACNGGVQYVNQILVYHRRHEENATGGKGFGYMEAEYRQNYNELLQRHLYHFSRIQNMRDDYKVFYLKLLSLWEAAMLKGYSKELFSFLVRNRRIIFYQKKRKIGIISHSKHANYLAKNIGFKK